MPSTQRRESDTDRRLFGTISVRGVLSTFFVLFTVAALAAAPAMGAVGSLGSADASIGPQVASHEEPDEDINRSQDVRSIEYGDIVGGEISEDDPQTDEYRGYHEPITFEGSAGDAVSIQMAADPRAGGYRHGQEAERPQDPYLMLVSPDGDVIARSDDAQGFSGGYGPSGLNSRIEGAVLPEDGEYTIVATSFGETETFPYVLQLQSDQRETTDLRSIELNSTATGQIDKTDEFSQQYRGFYEPVTFDAESGQTVRVDMGAQRGDTYLTLLGPDGTVIAENDDNDRSLNSTIERTTLNEDGQYTIIASSYSPGDTFEYQLSVDVVGSDESAGADVRQISAGQTVSSELDADDPNAPFLRGTYEPITFEGQAGQVATITMNSDRGDTFLYLYGPDGNIVAQNDDYNGLDSQIRTPLEENGEYTIIATSFDDDATFDYELSLETSFEGDVNTNVRSISYGETVESRIDQSDPESRIYRGFHEPVTLNGSAGDEVQISMSSERGDTYLILLAPNGTVVGENDDYRGLDSQITAELPTDGEYTIIATSFSPRDTFVYELSVERTDSERQ